MQQKLKIAIQKSGRLYEDSVKLLKDCGIDVKNGINKLKTEAENFPLEIYFLRDDDIPQYVEDAVPTLVLWERMSCMKRIKKFPWWRTWLWQMPTVHCRRKKR